MTADRKALLEHIAQIQEEADGGRERLYELYGSAIYPVLSPLALLLERNIDSNPELAQIVAQGLLSADIDEAAFGVLRDSAPAPKLAPALPVTDEQATAAARIQLIADRKSGRMTEDWIVRLAEGTADQAPAGSKLPEYFAPKPTGGILGGIFTPREPLPKLWRFHWNVGRQGDVEGVFIATDEEIESNIGAAVYFGEILGKHSEVYGTLDRSDLEVISDDPKFVGLFQQHIGSTGYNPLDYLEEQEED